MVDLSPWLCVNQQSGGGRRSQRQATKWSTNSDRSQIKLCYCFSSTLSICLLFCLIVMSTAKPAKKLQSYIMRENIHESPSVCLFVEGGEICVCVCVSEREGGRGEERLNFVVSSSGSREHLVRERYNHSYYVATVIREHLVRERYNHSYYVATVMLHSFRFEGMPSLVQYVSKESPCFVFVLNWDGNQRRLWQLGIIILSVICGIH